MDKAQLEYLIQKIMEQCVRDDYFVKKQIALPLLHKTNVQQSAELKFQLIQNQVDRSNSVNLSFTEKYINNIYDFFYKLIHHEKYRYMDDYIYNPNHNEQKALNNNNYIYAILKPIIQKLKNKQSCNSSSDELNSNNNTTTLLWIYLDLLFS